MIAIKVNGNFDKTDNFFKRILKTDYMSILKKYAEEGMNALMQNTPIDSGKTAEFWSYRIEHYPDSGASAIYWLNSNIVDGIPVAILIQYGHVTGNGGFVQGRDFVNPAIRPILDKIANDIWGEVSKI